MANRIPPPMKTVTQLNEATKLVEEYREGTWHLTVVCGSDTATAVITADKPVDRTLYVNSATSSERTAPFLAYAIARRARILRLRALIFPQESEAARVSGATRVGTEGALGQRQDLAYHAALQLMPHPERPGVEAWTEELRETALRGIDVAFDKAFYKALEDRSLSYHQYIYTLSNMHGFVRWTTRIASRIVSISNEDEVRNEWLSHLQDEVNHEKILEKDLAYLGADVEYVRNDFVPNTPTRAFMAGQEALAAFCADPIVVAAAPIAAEGIAGQWGPDITEPLKECIASWGYDHPQRAAQFIISHAGYDGGEDGHWAQTLRFAARHLGSEKQLAAILVNLHVCLDAMVECYDSYVTDVVALR